jgi:hypothetical protein
MGPFGENENLQWLSCIQITQNTAQHISLNLVQLLVPNACFLVGFLVQ